MKPLDLKVLRAEHRRAMGESTMDLVDLVRGARAHAVAESLNRLIADGYLNEDGVESGAPTEMGVQALKEHGMLD